MASAWLSFLFYAHILEAVDDLLLTQKSHMPVNLFALFIEEDLRGNGSDAEASGRRLVLPDIEEDYSRLPGILIFQLRQDRRHHFAGDALSGAQIDQRDHPFDGNFLLGGEESQRRCKQEQKAEDASHNGGTIHFHRKTPNSSLENLMLSSKVVIPACAGMAKKRGLRLLTS